MALISYTVSRNVPAEKDNGESCLIAIALVVHENGVRQRVAINEELIRFAGEGIIDQEVRKAAALPSVIQQVRNGR